MLKIGSNLVIDLDSITSPINLKFLVLLKINSVGIAPPSIRF